MSWPSLVVPRKNSTFVTLPPVSEAVALRLTVAGAVNFAPFAGWVSVTVGGGFAGGAAVTVIDVGGVVVDASPLSVALAVSAYVPGPTPLQSKVNGDVWSSPIFVPLL